MLAMQTDKFNDKISLSLDELGESINLSNFYSVQTYKKQNKIKCFTSNKFQLSHCLFSYKLP